MLSRTLRFYGALFALCGAAFVCAAPLVVAALNIAAAFLPAARPLPEPGPTLWLGLTGSMMAMIAYLSLELAWDPAQDAAWNALLLSKACSTALFAAFAAVERNSLFLVGSAVDGSIFLHLLWLRGRVESGPFAARADGAPAYEVWFAKLNDPKTRNALWLRYTRLRRTAPYGHGRGTAEPSSSFRGAAAAEESACWYVLFDREGGAVRSGRWSEADALRGLTPGRAASAHDGVAWDIRWSAPQAPAFGFIPRALALTGAAASGYATPVSLARFAGRITIDGREYAFDDAPGCLGHVWGRRMAHDWRWAHAVLPDGRGGESVLEILSARVRLGPWLSPRLTSANLWHGGRLYRSLGLRRALANRSEREGDEWSFELDLGVATVSGRCRPAEGLTATVDYESPDGRRLVCRNSKTGSLSARFGPRDGEAVELSTPDAAAVEFVEEAA